MLDQGGPEHSLEAVEVGRAVVELSALSRFRIVRMLLGEPVLRTLEVGSGGVPVALGVEEAVEQPRLPPGVAAGIRRLEHLAGEWRGNSQHMGAEAVTVDKDLEGFSW